MSYTLSNPNGQAASANSAPVVIALDQTAIPIAARANLIGKVNTSAQRASRLSLQPQPMPHL